MTSSWPIPGPRPALREPCAESDPSRHRGRLAPAAAFPAGTAFGADEPVPPPVELYLVQTWSGAPLASRIMSWQKIPLSRLTLTLTDPGQSFTDIC
jgi:hypothetical protein